MLGLDDETLLLVIQVVSLVLVAIQYVPQIKQIYQDKEKAVKNLSMESWIYKVLFSVFFVLTLFLAETTLIVAVTQFINLSLSAVVLGQIVYYSHVEVIPKYKLHAIETQNEKYAFLKEAETELIKDYHLIPIIHNLIKQIFVIDYKTLPIQLY